MSLRKSSLSGNPGTVGGDFQRVTDKSADVGVMMIFGSRKQMAILVKMTDDRENQRFNFPIVKS